MTVPHYRDRSHDVTDGIERHVFSEQEYLKEAGSIVKVKGTDSEDQEAPVLVGSVSFNLKKDHNTEVFLLASSSDTTLKMAVMTIPKDKQRRWEEGSGGVQHPTDAEFALDFSDKLAHLTKNKFAVGEKGEFEVKGEEMYIRSKKVIIDGELIVNKQVKTPTIAKGNEDPPKFEGSKQAELKDKGEGSQTGQFELDFGS
jgi:hypothetical protein